MSKFFFNIGDTEYIATVDTVYDLWDKEYRGQVAIDEVQPLADVLPTKNRIVLVSYLAPTTSVALDLAKALLIDYLEENGKYFSIDMIDTVLQNLKEIN
jgi:hypothetical protein